MKENADKARAMDAAELAKQLREGAEQSFRIRFQMSMGQAEGIKKLRTLRKERARMLTILRERELAGAAAPATTAVMKPAKKSTAPKPAAPAKAKPEAKAAAAEPKKAAPKKVAVKKTAAKPAGSDKAKGKG
jgi:large subunit ribosomal protein L29